MLWTPNQPIGQPIGRPISQHISQQVMLMHKSAGAHERNFSRQAHGFFPNVILQLW